MKVDWKFGSISALILLLFAATTIAVNLYNTAGRLQVEAVAQEQVIATLNAKVQHISAHRTALAERASELAAQVDNLEGRLGLTECQFDDGARYDFNSLLSYLAESAERGPDMPPWEVYFADDFMALVSSTHFAAALVWYTGDAACAIAE